MTNFVPLARAPFSDRRWQRAAAHSEYDGPHRQTMRTYFRAKARMLEKHYDTLKRQK
jgi:hypothetical protein